MGDQSPILFSEDKPMPRYKKSEREKALSDTRRLLLQAAAGEFARLGYSGANVDHISKSAGFAKGTIYNYFESKRALMLALIQEFSSAHYDYIAGQVLQEPQASQRVKRFFQAGYAFVETHLSQGRVMVNNLYGPEAEFKQEMYQAYLPMFELVGRDIIALGISQGVFRQVEPASTAGMVMSIYLGMASQINEEGKPWIPASQVADFVLHALIKKGRTIHESPD
jgi:AcrR family transcriptional regulator